VVRAKSSARLSGMLKYAYGQMHSGVVATIICLDNAKTGFLGILKFAEEICET